MAIDKKTSEVARAKIGKFLKEERMKKNISAYKIVKDAGIAPPQISAIEDGSSNYTINALIAYLEAIEFCVCFAPKIKTEFKNTDK